ncbi:unnamed protein product, partial [Didymodactylos carnosus]
LELCNKFDLLDEDADAAIISDEADDDERHQDDGDTIKHQRNVLSTTH